jgi:Smg protein
MKENVLDILMYLFENYFSEELEEEPDPQTLETELVEAGFEHPKVQKAFTWLDALVDGDESSESLTAMPPASPGSVRIYTDQEQQKLSSQARSFLGFLEESGVIDAGLRELVIDRIMALDSEEIDTEELSWVLLMILYHRPGNEAAYVWMEDMIFDRLDGVYH